MSLAVLCLAGLLSLAASAGAVLIAYVLLSAYQLRAARRWPATVGTIVAVNIRQIERPIDDDPQRLRVVYYPDIQYEYTVAGKAYQSNRLSLGLPAGYATASRARQAAQRFTVGQKVTVYYNPQAPAEATLARGVAHGWQMLLLGIGSLLLACMLLPWLLALAQNAP